MLQTIREYTQGWIAGAIITIIIMTFALWGIHTYFEGGSSNSEVAEVNGKEITKQQLTVAYEHLRRQAKNQYSSNNPMTAQDESSLKNRALQSLIDLEVLKQASGNQGFLISDRQIDNYLQNMPEFQVNGQFSIDRFQEILALTSLSTSEFLELIRESILIDQLKFGIIFTSFSLPLETAQTLALINQERDIEYVNISTQSFLIKSIPVSQEKIKTFYNENKTHFMTPEQVNIEYIQLSLKGLAEKFNPTEIMLKSFYNENINSYTQPMQWKIASIELPISTNATQEEIKQIIKNSQTVALAMKNTSDLSKLAKEYSADFKQRGWMTLNQAPVDMQNAIANLTKGNDVSPPFKTEKGWMIVKADAIEEPKMLTFDAVKDKVKEAYVRQHAEEKFSDLREQLADLTYEHPESLQFAAATLNLPIETSELFTKEKPGKDISQYKKVRDAAFTHDVMTLQNNSDVIQINPETIIVLRVKSHIPSLLLPLKEVSKQIEDKLKSEEAVNQAKKFANELSAKLNSGENRAKIAKTYKLKWNTTGFIGRYSTKVDPAILDLAFRMPNPLNLNVKITYGVAHLPNGFVVVALKDVKPGSIPDKKQMKVYSEQLETSNGLLEYELYKQSQIDSAKIKVIDAN